MQGLPELLFLEVDITQRIVDIDKAGCTVRPHKYGQALQGIFQRAVVIVQIVEQVGYTGKDDGLGELVAQLFVYDECPFKVGEHAGQVAQVARYITLVVEDTGLQALVFKLVGYHQRFLQHLQPMLVFALQPVARALGFKGLANGRCVRDGLCPLYDLVGQFQCLICIIASYFNSHALQGIYASFLISLLGQLLLQLFVFWRIHFSSNVQRKDSIVNIYLFYLYVKD